jgi:Na+-driven multidrug efflux pump
LAGDGTWRESDRTDAGQRDEQLIRYSVPIITSGLLHALYGMTDM